MAITFTPLDPRGHYPLHPLREGEEVKVIVAGRQITAWVTNVLDGNRYGLRCSDGVIRIRDRENIGC